MTDKSTRRRPGERLRRSVALAAAGSLLALGLPALSTAPAAQADTPPASQAEAVTTGSYVFPGNDGQPHEITHDINSFMVDGERLSIWSGEFHYWRLPSPEHWRDLMQKIKASGFNTVSLYFFWGFHQSVEGGEYDFSGIKDIDRLLTMAAEEGLYVIVRPGPYINAEISMGGLPAYMTNREGALRSTDPENLASSLEWLGEFNDIAREHQITEGKGSVIMYQVENEMIADDAPRQAFMRELTSFLREDGITVPLFHNDYGHGLAGRFTPPEDFGLDFYAYDSYPLGFNCGGDRRVLTDNEAGLRRFDQSSPNFITEGQGGAFTPWGASFNTDQCAEFVDSAFTRQWGANVLGNGVTAFNYYMAFGGTNWGWTGSPSSGFTSYDYGAALDEARQLTPKLSAQKELAYFVDSVPQLTSMDPAEAPTVTVEEGSGVKSYQRLAHEDLDQSVTGHGTRYLGFRLNDSNDTTTTSFSFPLRLSEGGAVENGDYTWDDTDTDALTFVGDWEAASGQPWTVGNYQDTETFSSTAGDYLEVTFTGTGVQVISPQGRNHGYGDVYIDGELVGRTDTYSQPQNRVMQYLAFEELDLEMGEHTLRIEVTGEKPAASEDTFVSIDAINVIAPEVEEPRYTTDDTDTDAITYTGTWNPASGQPWTAGDYLGTETWSDEIGASVEYTFTGTGIRVISPYSVNHGYADVYIDGELVGQTNTYKPAPAEGQRVAFEKLDLEPGEHTIRLVVTGESDPASQGHNVSIDAFDVVTGEEEDEGVYFARVPQQEDTSLTLHGRDALMMVADYRVGEHDMYYSTSQVLTHLPTDDGRLLVLSGHAGDAGETVLRYDSEPTVTVEGEPVASVWDADTSTLRLNYSHGQDSVVQVSGGGAGEDLWIIPGSRDDVATTWRVEGALGDGNAATLVTGAELVRTVTYAGDTAHLTGSVSEDSTVTVHLPEGITEVTWNGEPLTDATTGQTLPTAVSGSVPGPLPVATPELTEWKVAQGAPESAVDFDDSAWLTAEATSADNPRQGPGPTQGVVLDSNFHRFFEGDVWYRAHYTAGTDDPTIELNAQGGTAANMLVWVNGTYVGARNATGGWQSLQVPAGTVEAGDDVVVSVLVRNQGQNLDWSDNGLSKQPRGLWDARLGSEGDVTWRIQGARDVDDPVDVARTMYNNGGLYGERAGWYLPGYPDDAWDTVDTLVTAEPGVHWYRTSFELDVPEGQDTAFGLEIDSSRFDNGRQDFSRTVMFVNGWNIGTYVGNVGPQTLFTIPSGFLDMSGENEVAIALTTERPDMGPEAVNLVQLGNMTGGMPAVQNAAPELPEASLDLELTDGALAGEPVTLDTTVELPALAGGAVTELVVDWGDGSQAQVADSDDAVEHVYAAAGSYDVTVELRDAVGGAVLAEATATVVVTETEEPTTDPTDEPTGEPTDEPTVDPTEDPTDEPTVDPTTDPTDEPTVDPTTDPTDEPTVEPTTDPSVAPTSTPTDDGGVGGVGTDGDDDAGGEGLPSTGAPVTVAAAVTVALLLLGALLVTRRRASAEV